MIIVMGDLSAKVGNERFDEIVGPWELGNRNDRGERGGYNGAWRISR